MASTPNLRHRPRGTTTIKCPSCGHTINDHRRMCRHSEDRTRKLFDCGCLWTPNDIAYDIVFGNLTTVVPVPDPYIDRDWS